MNRRTAATFLLTALTLAGAASIGSAQDTPDAPKATDAAGDSADSSDSGGAQDSSPASVQDLGFKYLKGQSRMEITFDKDVTFEKTVSDVDKQVIIDIKNAKIGKKWARRIDTSQQKSNIALISPYQSGDLVRVVLQLKDSGGVEVTQDGSKVVALIDNKELPASEPKKEDLAKDLSNPEKKTESPDAGKAAEPVTPSIVATGDTPPAATPAPVEVNNNDTENADSLNTFFDSQRSKNYVGKRIFLQVRDAELSDVFRVISEASEFNIVLSDNVKGKVMLNLTDVPWDQALDLILHSYHLAAERQGNVLRVTTLEALTKEKEAETAAKRAAEEAEPLVVKIFPVSYGKLADIKTILQDFLSRDAGASSSSTAPSQVQPVFGSAAAGATLANGGGQVQASSFQTSTRGSIQVDPRTNSLIVRDTPSTIEKIKRILKELDTPTPQILIEGKFVEVSESNSRDVQGRIFATSREFDSASNSMLFNPTSNNFGTLFGGSGFGGGTSPALPAGFAITPVQGASFGFSPKTGIIPGVAELGAFLSILETESQSKIIASPRVVTQNKEQAEITQGEQFQIPIPPAPNAPGGFQSVTAVLKLTVTPQVTNEGSISMKISFAQDSLDSPPAGATFAVATKKVDTNVLIDSGATLVIGGIYTSQYLNQEAGIPVLRDLPIIGVLFGSKTKSTQKSELFIFLTPRVINDKETGTKG